MILLSCKRCANMNLEDKNGSIFCPNCNTPLQLHEVNFIVAEKNTPFTVENRIVFSSPKDEESTDAHS